MKRSYVFSEVVETWVLLSQDVFHLNCTPEFKRVFQRATYSKNHFACPVTNTKPSRHSFVPYELCNFNCASLFQSVCCHLVEISVEILCKYMHGGCHLDILKLTSLEMQLQEAVFVVTVFVSKNDKQFSCGLPGFYTSNK